MSLIENGFMGIESRNGILADSTTSSPTCYITGMARKLRIAVSVFFGVVTVALAVLWVTSCLWLYSTWARYHRLDVLVRLHRGAMIVDIDTDQTSDGPGTMPKVHWHAGIRESKYFSRYLVPNKLTICEALGFRYTASGSVSEIDIPIWFLTFASLAVAVIPWHRSAHRFSFRTLLIATTLVAVGLGVAAWVEYLLSSARLSGGENVP